MFRKVMCPKSVIQNRSGTNIKVQVKINLENKNILRSFLDELKAEKFNVIKEYKQSNVNPLGYIQGYKALNLKPRCLYIPANVIETKEKNLKGLT